jgi:Zn-finger domain-containing protein
MQRYKDSIEAINETNDFLDSLQNPNEQSLEKLLEYRTKMIELGFNSPFKTLFAKMSQEYIEDVANEAQDIKKHLKEIRYLAFLKRSTLNRVRVAIASHHLLNAFKDFDATHLNKYLPIEGDYKKRIINAGESTAQTYHELVSKFENRQHKILSASAIVSFMQDGIKKEENIEIQNGENAQDVAKQKFGENAVVEDLKLKRKTPTLIKNHSTKTSLFCAVCTYAQEIVEKKMIENEKEDENIKIYNQILRQNGLVADSQITQSERFEDVKEKIHEHKLIEKKGFDWEMSDEFASKLHRRREQRRKMILSIAQNELFKILQWYYICHSKDSRSTYGAMPSVIAQPKKEQLIVMNEISPIGYAIKNPTEIIFKKIQMEDVSLPLSSKIWGPAFVCIESHADAKWIATEFKIEQKELETAILLIRPLIEKPDGRGAQFLQSLKKKKD